MTLQGPRSACVRAPDAAAPPALAAVEAAATRIRADPADGRTLARMAAEAGVSRFQFLRAFRAAFGVTPQAYRAAARVSLAKALLAEGLGPADVAVLCGYADQSHLTRAFKRAVGTTPATYARSLRRAQTDAQIDEGAAS